MAYLRSVLVFGVWLVGATASAPLAGAESRDADLFIRPEDQHTVLFGSLDAGRSTFVSGGSKQTLTGPLDRSGFVAMEYTGYGLTQERLRSQDIDLPVRRFSFQTTALAGYQWAWNGLYVAALAGPEVLSDQLTVNGRIERFSQPRLGGRAQLEVWSNPTPETLLTGTVIAGSARTSIYARASAGVRAYADVFVGPEVTTYMTPSYSEIRWGAHVTGPAITIVNFRLSAGWIHDDAHRRGSPYAGLSAWMRL